jgi:hypothetical protein
MASSDVQLNDPQDLKNFASDVRQLASDLTDYQKQVEADVILPAPVAIGQNATGTTAPFTLGERIRGRMSDIGANFQTLINELNLVADTAEKIAGNYTTASALDSMDAHAVDAELAAS